MHDIAVIILAAGCSKRMGASNKLLLPINDVAMVRHVVMTYRSAIDGPITVVTGHDAEKVECALAHLDVSCVFNAGYANGQQTSVAVGLHHAPDATLLLIGLADQPLLRAADIHALVDAHRELDAGKVSVPRKENNRGNPIIVPHALRAALMIDPNRPGCMRFTRENPALVQWHPLNANGFYADIDTPPEYAALCSKKETTL